MQRCQLCQQAIVAQPQGQEMQSKKILWTIVELEEKSHIIKP